MKKEYRLKKDKNDKQNFYILKNNIALSLRQLSLQDLLIVSVVNKIYNFENLIDDSQKIHSYSDLKVALEFCERVQDRLPQTKLFKAVHSLDERDLFSHVTEYAQMGNTIPLEIVKTFSHTEENSRKEKTK